MDSDNTYPDLDYSGYHKKDFFEEVTTNTPSQRAQLDIALGNHVLGAQSVSLIESDHIFCFGDLTCHMSGRNEKYLKLCIYFQPVNIPEENLSK